MCCHFIFLHFLLYFVYWLFSQCSPGLLHASLCQGEPAVHRLMAPVFEEDTEKACSQVPIHCYSFAQLTQGASAVLSRSKGRITAMCLPSRVLVLAWETCVSCLCSVPPGVCKHGACDLLRSLPTWAVPSCNLESFKHCVCELFPQD